MISFWRQLRFLLWKGILVKRRQKFWLGVEILVPIVLFAILALVRTRDFTDSEPQCHYESKGFPSAGLLPFLHSFLCSLSNQCTASPSTGDEGFYINNVKNSNESIVVDFLYYSSLQLEYIGKNPEKWQLTLTEFTELVKMLAGVNLTAVPPFKFVELFLPEYDLVGNLTKMGLTAPMASALVQSTLTFAAPFHAFQFLSKIRAMSFFDMIFEADNSIPFLCNRTVFNQSFVLPRGFLLNEDDLASLCKMTVSDVEGVSGNINKNPSMIIPMLNGQTLQLGRVTEALTALSSSVSNQPLGNFLDKWKNRLGSKEEIFNAVTCGVNPLEQEIDGMKPKSGVKTPFDKMKDDLINFIQAVVPGHDPKHKKEFCGVVPVHDDLNCSSLEGALIHRIRPILQGYILVSPDTVATRKLVDILNEPLRKAEWLRYWLYEWPSLADSFQDALHQSDFWQASQNVLEWLQTTQTVLPIPASIVEKIEFGLEHVFNSSSDPYSLGAQTKEIAQTVNMYSSCFLADRFVMIENEEEMEKEAVCLMEYDQYFSGIFFVNLSSDAKTFDKFTSYKIRHLPSLVDGTKGIADSASRIFSRDKPFVDLKYLTFGFSYLQESVDRALIELRSATSEKLGVYSQQEPYPCASKDNFNIANFLGLFVVLSFIIPASLLVKNIVHEKELKLKEQMRIMGLGDTVHFFSWALISMVLNIFSIIIITVILKIALSLLLSTLFTNANISTAATCVVFFLFFFPFQLSVKNKSKAFARFTMIFPQTVLGYSTMALTYANEIDQAKWEFLHDIYLNAYGVSLVQCMIAFAAESLGFLILAWYISAIAPGVYGVAQPWYFPLKKSYWFPNSRSNYVEDQEDNFDRISPNNSFESDPSDQKMTVNIVNMCKTYGSGTKALDSLSLRLYENQITALLGHNGAGKTTTMSILCGLYSPSEGTASIYGRDIRRDLRRVRELLGICPQYNVLFSLLTVSEQLKFFAALKGTTDDVIDREVNEILDSVCLTDKADSLANTLSGGMKRRLCIGIALIGGSRLVILDEPTAGVDVNSRKDIWKLLQNNKQGRTILLSTHHMDEADVLSDRVAVLSEGQLIAVGSPVFLKRKFGDCYTLIACKEDRSIDYTETRQKIIDEAEGVNIRLLDENEDELIYGIPIDVDSEAMESFFRVFDQRINLYNIVDYGISAPTLQQIFVRLTPQREYIVPKDYVGWGTRLIQLFRRMCRRKAARDTDQAELIGNTNGNYQIAASVSSPTLASGSTSATELKILEQHDYDLEVPTSMFGWERTRGHIRAILACRYHYTMRNTKTLLFEIILPICLLFFCELYALSQRPDPRMQHVVSQPPLPLVEGLFGNYTDSYLDILDRNQSTYSWTLSHSLTTNPGFGIRCADDSPYLAPFSDQLVLNERELLESNGNYIRGRESSVGCVYNLASGSFNYSVNASMVPYNADVLCECTQNIGWNCTMEDFPLWENYTYLTLNTTQRLWDFSYRNLSQMRMDTRWTNNITDEAPFFMGGFSLGHNSLRAMSPENVENAQAGWLYFIEGMSNTAKNLLVNFSSVHTDEPRVVDPFVQNITSKQFVDAVLANLDTEQNTKVWFNNKLWPSLPIYANALSNALLRTRNPYIDPRELGILTINHPMNQTVEDGFDSNAIQKLVVFRIVLVVLVLCIIPAGFTVFLVEDRVCDSYHLQLVSGLGKSTYWLTGYFFDMVVYTFSIVAILMIYLIFQVKEFTYDPQTFFSFFLLFFLYGMCGTLWAYVLQRRFTVPALSFVLISVGTFFVGIVCSLTVIIIEQLMQTDSTLTTSHTVCSWLFLILPQYNLGMAIFRGSFVYTLAQMGITFLEDLNRPDLIKSLPLPYILEWNMMGMHCVVLLCQSIIAGILLIVFESGSFAFLRIKERKQTRHLLESEVRGEDEDVQTEIDRVKTLTNTHQTPLVVDGLAKAYSSTHLAVRGVTFTVAGGECFGLLGLNGAGKTTTFGMLTGKLHPGAGSIYLHGYNVCEGSTQAFGQLGYCPQFDALNTRLTTKENLVFFARIRAIPENQIEKLSIRLLKALHLRPYASTLTSSLSGGNKRKLSVAIALISQPSLVLLDEPSAGMDPGSQQFLWKVIEKLRRSGKAVVMTSHSMEECEALCTRIAIMDKGKIRCLGSKQHLKNKFGDGYSLTVKLASAVEATQAAEELKTILPQARLEAQHCSTLFLNLDRDKATIAGILSALNKLKKTTVSVEDYSLSQATLAEVFHSLAARQWQYGTSPATTPNAVFTTLAATSVDSPDSEEQITMMVQKSPEDGLEINESEENNKNDDTDTHQ